MDNKNINYNYFSKPKSETVKFVSAHFRSEDNIFQVLL